MHPSLLNHDGTPKVLYHQTDGEFPVSDVGRYGAGTRDNETPFGVFLIALKKKSDCGAFDPLLPERLRDIEDEPREEIGRAVRDRIRG